MKFVIVLAALLAAAFAQECGNPAVDPDRIDDFVGKIVGGTFSEKKAIPWQIHLGYKSGMFGSTQWICGGTIISNRWILTAAHCIISTSASSYTIRTGQTDSSVAEASLKEYKVKRVIKHPSFSSSTLNNDIALLEISEASGIVMDDHRKSACLPAASSDPASGAAVIASGWGETQQNGKSEARSPFADILFPKAVSKKLKQVKVNVVSRTTCNQQDYYGGIITSNMFCAGSTGKDSCQGDSGGPTVQKGTDGRYTVVGVVSWGYGCGANKKPGVYCRVSNYRSWMQPYIGF